MTGQGKRFLGEQWLRPLIRRNRIPRRPAIKTLPKELEEEPDKVQEKEQEDEQDKVKDKDQEYGYDQEYELTSAVCLLISYKGYMFFNCFLLT